MSKTHKDTVTISRSEFNKLKKQAKAYQKLATRVFELPLRAPIAEVIEDFRETDLYAEKFLRDLEDGLKKSSWKSNR